MKNARRRREERSRRRVRLRVVAALLGAVGAWEAPPGVGSGHAQDLTGESWVGDEMGGAFDAAADERDPGPRRSTYRLGAGPMGVMPPFHVVQRGDTLWDISGRYYGDPYDWPRLWAFNPEITNPHWIYPEHRVRLRAEADVAAEAAPTHLEAAPAARRERRRGTGAVVLREEGFLDREALRQAGEIVGSPAEHMMLSVFDQVYVQFGPDAQPRPSQELTVFGEAPADEAPPEGTGTLVRVYGAVRLDSYDRERRLARATIVEALDPIERGHRVAAIPRRFDEVPARRNERELEARVAASLRPRTMLGEQQVVFLDVGGEQGVQLGNRFFVVRQGDEWTREIDTTARDPGRTVSPTREPERYPEEVIAELRVVHVRPRTAAALVTASTREVLLGDRAVMRRGY
jgi:hypothetical protein